MILVMRKLHIPNKLRYQFFFLSFLFLVFLDHQLFYSTRASYTLFSPFLWLIFSTDSDDMVLTCQYLIVTDEKIPEVDIHW